MRLIGLAVILTLSLTLAPLAAEAQQAGKVPRVGSISPGSPSLLARGDEVIQSPTQRPAHVRDAHAVNAACP